MHQLTIKGQELFLASVPAAILSLTSDRNMGKVVGPLPHEGVGAGVVVVVGAGVVVACFPGELSKSFTNSSFVPICL